MTWLLLLFMATSAAAGTPQTNSPYPVLEKTAQESLMANLAHLDRGTYLSAGSHQFRGLWTRDFCFASRGLIALGLYKVVKDQLDLILGFMRASDHQLPRYLDSITVFERYAQLAVGINLPVGNDIKPEYDQTGSGTIDGNMLVILTALDYVHASGDSAWWKQNKPQLDELYTGIRERLDPNGLISQNPYSDWQDSVTRSGETFYTNLLYYAVTDRFGNRDELAQLKEKIDDVFFDSSTRLYRSIAGYPQISLDGNLLAIDLGLTSPKQSKDLYLALKRHPLWTLHRMGPGFVTFPNYPLNWISDSAILVGLRHYHDEIYWSWLIALSGKISHQMGDEDSARKIFTRLQSIAKRDHAIAEIYKPYSWLPDFHSALHDTEIPFSWGAGLVLDALRSYE